MRQAVQRPWSVVLLFALVFTAGLGAWALLPGVREAVAGEERGPVVAALVHVPSRAPWLLQADPPPSADEIAAFRATQVELVKSRLVLNAALRDPKVAALKLVQDQADPLAWLVKSLRADFVGRSDVLRITLPTAAVPDGAAVVNAVTQSYVKEVARKEADARHGRLTKLKEVYADTEQKLQEKRRLLRTMAEDLGAPKGDRQAERMQDLAVKAVDALQAELLDVQSKLRRTRMALVTQGKADAPPPAAVLEQVWKADAVLAGLQFEAAAVEQEQYVVKQKVRDPAPEHQRLAARLTDLRKAIAARRDELRPAAADRARADHEAARRTLEADADTMSQQERWLTTEMEKRLNALAGLRKRAVDVEWLRDEMAVAEDLTRKLAARISDLQIEMQAPDRVTVLQDAAADRE